MTTDDGSVDKNNVESEIMSPPFDSRELLLNKLDEAIEYLHNKALKGRITRPENEKVRIQYFKALTYACSIYNQIKRDVELDELKDEVEQLKSQLNGI